MSLPSPGSHANVSSPAPMNAVSLPRLPSTKSLPSPPRSVSTPWLPASVSSPVAAVEDQPRRLGLLRRRPRSLSLPPRPFTATWSADSVFATATVAGRPVTTTPVASPRARASRSRGAVDVDVVGAGEPVDDELVGRLRVGGLDRRREAVAVTGRRAVDVDRRRRRRCRSRSRGRPLRRPAPRSAFTFVTSVPVEVVDGDGVGAAERVEVDLLDAVGVHRDVRRRRG